MFYVSSVHGHLTAWDGYTTFLNDYVLTSDIAAMMGHVTCLNKSCD